MNFVAELHAEIAQALSKLDEIPVLPADMDARAATIDLLKIALKNEIEASEIAAQWLCATPEIDAKLGLARQCGDEAKHYRLIAARLNALGFDTSGFSPLAAGYSPLFNWLKTLASTVERMAAGPFVREAIAIKRNTQFIAALDQLGDRESAALYRDQIQPDEQWHHDFGRAMLEKYATTPELRTRARDAALRTLALADELRQAAIIKTGHCAIPGC